MKNLVVFDLETTGLDKSKDQIIQFAAIKIDPSTNKIIDEYQTYVQPEGSYSIAMAAYFKHGITAEFLKDKPKFAEVADKIIEFIGDSDILTYNGCSFDIPFIIAAFNRAGKSCDFLSRSCFDAFLEEKRRNGNTLECTYARYRGKTMDEAGLKAHDALSDVKATYSVFVAQQRNAPYGPEKMIGEDNFIVMMDFQTEMVPCFTQGKYRCISVDFVSKIDQEYLKWCVEKSGLTASTKAFIAKYLNK